MKFHIMSTNLALFDGGAAAGGASAAGSAAAGDGGQAGSQASPASSQRGKTGDNVVYGKPPAAEAQGSGSDAGGHNQEVKTTSNTLEERRAKFREMVQGEYKDIYTQETQGIIDRRFRETRGLQERLEAQQPLLDLLAQRYNVSDGDVTKILQAVENDNAYWSEAAEQAGMTVEQYKEVQKFRRENEQMRRALTRQQQQSQAEQQYNIWMQESKAMQEQYPDFDLRAEIQNPRFVAMLRSGVPIETAYQVAHLEEIKSKAAAAREKAVTDNIRAAGQRPLENISAQTSGVTYKSDVSKLTKEDRRKIAEQACAGKKITF